MSFRKLGDRFSNLGNRVGKGSGQNFKPTDIVGLTAWYKSDAGLYQDVGKLVPSVLDGDAVATWEDFSGNGNDLLQAVAADQPQLKIGLQNNRNIVRFDGVSEYLQSLFTIDQPNTYFLVFCQNTWTNGDHIIGGAAANAGVIIQNGASPNIDAFSGVFLGTITDLAISSFGLIRVTFNGANSSIASNDNAETAGNVGANNSGGINMAANFALSRWADVDIGEMLVYNRALGDAEIERNKLYLNSRWSIY